MASVWRKRTVDQLMHALRPKPGMLDWQIEHCETRLKDLLAEGESRDREATSVHAAARCRRTSSE
jgi:hypothetical protein